MLDLRPPTHPAALESRRELRLVNDLMGNFRWFLRELPSRLRARERVLELGSGTGELGLLLSRRLRRHFYAGIDFWPRPALWPRQWAWWSTDALDFTGYGSFPVVLSNLTLHQFHEDELAALGAVLNQHARLIVACEPARRTRHLWQVALLGWLGVKRFARCEARDSIRAGFVGDELPKILGLSPREWNITVKTGFRGYYRMVAVRRDRVRPRHRDDLA